MSQEPRTATCVACGATVELLDRKVGWVDVVEGGTYDICPEGAPRYEGDLDAPHRIGPVRLGQRWRTVDGKRVAGPVHRMSVDYASQSRCGVRIMTSPRAYTWEGTTEDVTCPRCAPRRADQ